jgi:two-component system catabolic regulation response regulator CreB
MHNKTILIVEDETEIADALIYVLKAEGIQPIWVDTAKAALETLSETEVDFVILDVGLPDGNGFDLFKTIRENYAIPMMFLTARSEEIDRIVGLEIGADDYVTKPFSPREVVARVKNILKRVGGNTSQQTPTSKGDFYLDQQQVKISYQSQVLDLTRSEYLLLEALLSNPKQIFSRRQLIEAVWSTNHPSDDRVIDTHIKGLRQKLKAVNADNVPIITHRGFGYSLFE